MALSSGEGVRLSTATIELTDLIWKRARISGFSLTLPRHGTQLSRCFPREK